MPPKAQRPTLPKLTESQIQDAIIHRLQIDKWLVIRFNGGGFQKGKSFVRNYIIQGAAKSAGLPDVIAFRGNEFLMVEVKDAKGKLTDSQEWFHGWAKHFGVTVHVLRHWDEVTPLLHEVQS